MVNYLNGKIYKSSQTDKAYVGSTTKLYLSQRMSEHKADYGRSQRWNKVLASAEIVKYSDCEIILLESFPCNTKDELRAWEEHWKKETINCINKLKCFVTEFEAKEHKKCYYKQHKTELDAKRKDYYKENRSKILECDIAYTKKNKSEIAIHTSALLLCDQCGAVFCCDYRHKHIKMKKHQQVIQLLSSIQLEKFLLCGKITSFRRPKFSTDK